MAETRSPADLRRQAAVVALGRRALGETDLDLFLAETSREVAETLGVPFCQILELRPDEEVLVLRSGVGWDVDLIDALTIPASRKTLAGSTAASGKPVRVDDAVADVRFEADPLLAAQGIVSTLSVAISGRERPFGVLSVHDRRRAAFRDEDADFLLGVAIIVAQAVERADVERRLREVEDQLVETEHLAGMGHWIWDIPADVVTWSAALYRIFGYEPDAIRVDYATFLGHVHPEDRELVDRAVSRAYSSHQPFEFEHRLVRPSGEVRWLLGRGHVTGPPMRMTGTGLDITERKRAEQELVLERERRQALERPGAE